MIETINLCLNYFLPPQQYFWRWAEGVDVIVWPNDDTICYREDLMAVLQGVSHKGLPPLGSVLLMLAACQGRWKEMEQKPLEVLHEQLPLMEKLEGDPIDEALSYQIHMACKFLELISELPADLRTGAGRMHLVQQTLDEIAFEHDEEDARTILDEFGSGRLDRAVLLTSVTTMSRKRFKLEMGLLNKAALRYKDVHELEMALRTGLENLPAPAPLNVPELEEADVLQELEADPRTQGIARLTQRIVAALNIPMHAQGSSDQPLGGVSDITNRGNFDRLLLSELAYDDQLLMARLVNNEALYLRREEPPAKLNRHRTILIDTTIRLWGTPRVFALSAALACTLDHRHRGSTAAYALGGDAHQAVALNSKQGVLEVLSCLDPALHCVEGLAAFLQEQPASADGEIMLISDANLVKRAEFQRLLSEWGQPLSYLITVSRTGELEFFGYHAGASKLLSTAQLDLEELLSPRAQPKSRRLSEIEELPAFLCRKPSPLLFPPSRLNLTAANSFYVKDLGVFHVNEVQRLLFWSARDRGAKELLPYVEIGSYWWGSAGTGSASLLVTHAPKAFVKLYHFTPRTEAMKVIDLTDQLLDVQKVVYQQGLYYIKTWEGTISIDSITGEITKGIPKRQFEFSEGPLLPEVSDLYVLKNFIHTGYHVLVNVQDIYVNEQGELALDHQHLKLLNSNHLKFENRKADRVKTRVAKRLETETHLPGNPKIKLRRWIWDDGSEALLDARGLLHLKSADSDLPEITIVLALGKATAAWAADGTIAGADYFIGRGEEFVIVEEQRVKQSPVPSEIKKYTTAQHFYRDYLKPFIERLS